MKNTILVFAMACFLWSCEKEKVTPTTTVTTQEVLTDAGAIVIYPTYLEMATRAKDLKTKVDVFVQTPNADNLEATRSAWRSVRESWELSESFLFGPVSSENIDPGIDTWPVNAPDMDSLLNRNEDLTVAYITNQQESLKGFHPIEYMIFGENGTKTSTQFTTRQLAYLQSLCTYLLNRANELEQHWNPSNATNFQKTLRDARSGNAVYATQKDALKEIVTALAGIAEEVGSGKIEEPMVNADARLEESPFSGNSMTDFKNNIQGILNLYNCSFRGKSGKSLSGFVKQYNLSLDQRINNEAQAAIQALGNVTVPFGSAIFTQKQQLQNAQSALAKLQATLETDLSNLIQSRVTQ